MYITKKETYVSKSALYHISADHLGAMVFIQ